MASPLQFHALRETCHADDMQPMDTPCDQFGFVMGFDLECNPSPFDMDHAGGARHGVTQGRRCHMTQLDLQPDRAFPWLQPGQHCVPGRMFQEPDQPRGAQHRRHAAVGEVDGVLGLDDELLFAERSDFGMAFRGVIWSNRPRVMSRVTVTSARDDE